MTIVIRASWAANIPEGTGNTFILGTRAGLALNPVRLLGTVGAAGGYHTAHPRARRTLATAYPRGGALVRTIRGEQELMVKKDEVLNVIHAWKAVPQRRAGRRDPVGLVGSTACSVWGRQRVDPIGRAGTVACPYGRSNGGV